MIARDLALSTYLSSLLCLDRFACRILLGVYTVVLPVSMLLRLVLLSLSDPLLLRQRIGG
jgi:hypothetical protein